ncbi:MAG: glycosyltransferase family 4 protein [Chloroflexota bacterium]|nr:glycosyltransferase family 4 protein [Chloroflexota bacterium]
MKRVLFITYNFPPHGGAGVQRSLKFVKYLPKFDWQPLILTTTADASPVQDFSLLDDVPKGAPVWRVPGFSIARLQARLARHKLDKLAVALNLLLQVPDATRFWAQSTHTTISQIIQNERPQIIYTTSGPYSNHLAGMWAQRRFHIPWFADFRDPWSQNLLMPYLPGYRALNRRIERQVLAEADRVACVSEPWLDDLWKNLGEQPEKFIVLPNGYDETDIHPLPMPAKTDRFTLTHLGSFYRNRRPDALIQAVKLLVGSGRIPMSEIHVLFIGKNVRHSVPDAPPFDAQDYVAHKELHRFRGQTSAFLLILATSPDNIGNHSGKLFEYLASNRPILGIVPPGGVAEQLIKETRSGITVGGDVHAIADAIETLYRQWESGASDWNPNRDLIRQYTRRNLTARLAAEFDRLVASEASS